MIAFRLWEQVSRNLRMAPDVIDLESLYHYGMQGAAMDCWVSQDSHRLHKTRQLISQKCQWDCNKRCREQRVVVKRKVVFCSIMRYVSFMFPIKRKKILTLHSTLAKVWLARGNSKCLLNTLGIVSTCCTGTGEWYILPSRTTCWRARPTSGSWILSFKSVFAWHNETGEIRTTVC